jgi:hypothetical protein
MYFCQKKKKKLERMIQSIQKLECTPRTLPNEKQIYKFRKNKNFPEDFWSEAA